MIKSYRSKRYLLLIFVFSLLMGCGSSSTSNDFWIDSRIDSPEIGYTSDTEMARLFEEEVSDQQVLIQAHVNKILSDDNDGLRHQRFIINLVSGQTILVAHNIDLAPRIDELEVDDQIEIYGEYEWNIKGGVIHWTHHDPKHQHIDGWIKHNHKIFQ